MGAIASSAIANEALQVHIEKVRAAVNGGRPPEAISAANEMVEAFPDEPEALYVRAKMWNTFLSPKLAVEDLDRAIKIQPKNPVLLRDRAINHFLSGNPEASCKDFDQVVRLVPREAPHLWQRGISLYYAKRFAEGHQQFLDHRKVNPSDVENIFWNFICQARAEDLETAREELLDWDGGDNRVPMRELFGLLIGKVTPEEVLHVADTTARGEGPRRRNHLLYAHLYLGLYFEVLEEFEKSRHHLEKAATEFSMRHYMGDVARIHWNMIKDSPIPEPTEADSEASEANSEVPGLDDEEPGESAEETPSPVDTEPGGE